MTPTLRSRGSARKAPQTGAFKREISQLTLRDTPFGQFIIPATRFDESGTA